MSQLPCLSTTVAHSKAQLQPQRQYDVIVVGAGITGAGIARESARRGWSTLLLEQGDFASGTSNFSSKMVHGGLRYLAQGNWRLTKEAAQAREQLLQRWPDLVKPMPYLFTAQGPLDAVQHKFGLWLYYKLSGAHVRHKPVHFSQQELNKLLPGLTVSAPWGANRYFDAICDDAALVLRTLQEAALYGAHLCHYTPVLALGQSQPQQIEVTLSHQGQPITLQAKVAINATGVWADNLTPMPAGMKIRPQRGSHLLLPWQQLPLPAAMTFIHPQDQRVVFAYPWAGCTVLGTTDLDHLADKNQPCVISSAEQEYLLALLPLLGCQQQPTLLASWSGLRPIMAENNNTDAPSSVSREHLIWQQQRLLSISGGKLTTFVTMAEEVLDQAARLLPQAAAQADTPLQAPLQSDVEYWHGTQISKASLRYWSAHGAITQLSDLLIRRTRLGWVLGPALKQQQQQLQQLCQPLLLWDEQQWQQQWQQYWAEFDRQYRPHS
ncbi:FAD-dependent oxidoreductase [uncultured Ferrimonas sp.]|uniref:glycerol-3-phosphate dehydrogenase/oxidase n=1 Tax=uncultured Ferrimonas sp. TaxID=432640 RepID=UPI002638563B|nr:FAD-dependent oxidoreductase [uncultured Ferrimonas sp.]